jgi:HEPN domain-containing protein
MKKPEEIEVRGLVRQWIGKARKDADLVEHLAAEDRHREALGYHAQQAAEKYLKALLVRHQILFPSTHDIGKVLALLRPTYPELAHALADTDWLTQFGVEIRYPGDYPEMLPGDEKKALALMRQARDAVMSLLDSYLSEELSPDGSGSSS